MTGRREVGTTLVRGRAGVRTSEAEEAERLRLYYVAMTRAMDRLIVSGLRRPRERQAGERRRSAGCSTGSTSPTSSPRRATAPIEVRARRGDRRAARRPRRTGRRPTGGRMPCGARRRSRRRRRRGEPGQLALFAGSGEALPPPRAAAARARDVCRATARATSRGSRTARSRSSSAARTASTPSASSGMRPAPWAHGRGGAAGLHATELGDAVHRLLERVDLAAPGRARRAARSSCERGTRTCATTSSATDRDARRRVLRLGARDADRGARRRSPRATVRVRARRRAARTAGSTSSGVTGDARARPRLQDERARGIATPAGIVDAEYEVQRTVYALACLRAGVGEVEVVYQFLEAPDDVVAPHVRRRRRRRRSRRALRTAIRASAAGDFRPTPSPFACSGCPALDVVCAGPRLRPQDGGAVLEPTG